LDDEESDIRWIASEGLVKQGKDSIKPLLKVLMKKSGSVFVLAASHHVFNELYKHKKLPDDFPFDKIMPFLKITSPEEELKITVYHILNEKQGM
jgi:HEAT repeat protein